MKLIGLFVCLWFLLLALPANGNGGQTPPTGTVVCCVTLPAGTSVFDFLAGRLTAPAPPA